MTLTTTTATATTTTTTIAVNDIGKPPPRVFFLNVSLRFTF